MKFKVEAEEKSPLNEGIGMALFDVPEACSYWWVAGKNSSKRRSKQLQFLIINPAKFERTPEEKSPLEEGIRLMVFTVLKACSC